MKKVSFAKYATVYGIPRVPGTRKMHIPSTKRTSYSPSELETEIEERRRAELKRLSRKIYKFNRDLDDIDNMYNNIDMHGGNDGEDEDEDEDEDEVDENENENEVERLEQLGDRLCEIGVFLTNCQLNFSHIKKHKKLR